jgi:hypothetical protein
MLLLKLRRNRRPLLGVFPVSSGGSTTSEFFLALAFAGDLRGLVQEVAGLNNVTMW